MSTAKQLALTLIREITEEKRAHNRVPNYALAVEINQRIFGAITELTAEGALIQRFSSVNQYPAYEIPPPSS